MRKHEVKINDLGFRLITAHKRFNSIHEIPKILQLFEHYINDQPDTFRTNFWANQEVAISGFSDPIISNKLKRSDRDFELLRKDNSMLFGFSENEDSFLINVQFKNISFKSENTVQSCINLFIEICSTLPIDVAWVHNYKSYREFVNCHYSSSRRSLQLPGLLWLNFIGREEEELQGGRALENNPFATRIERFPNCLFIQVGNSPMDCLTKEGEQQLINATKALPTLKDEF